MPRRDSETRALRELTTRSRPCGRRYLRTSDPTSWAYCGQYNGKPSGTHPEDRMVDEGQAGAAPISVGSPAVESSALAASRLRRRTANVVDDGGHAVAVTRDG